MEKKFDVFVTTTGTCNGSPGPGAYHVIANCKGKKVDRTGYESRTSTGRIALLAAIEGISLVKRPSKITIRTNSPYVCGTIANLEERHANGWKKKTGAKYQYPDLLQRLYDLKHGKGFYEGVEGEHTLIYEYAGEEVTPDQQICIDKAEEEIRAHGGV